MMTIKTIKKKIKKILYSLLDLKKFLINNCTLSFFFFLIHSSLKNTIPFVVFAKILNILIRE